MNDFERFDNGWSVSKDVRAGFRLVAISYGKSKKVERTEDVIQAVKQQTRLQGVAITLSVLLTTGHVPITTESR